MTLLRWQSQHNEVLKVRGAILLLLGVWKAQLFAAGGGITVRGLSAGCGVSIIAHLPLLKLAARLTRLLRIRSHDLGRWGGADVWEEDSASSGTVGKEFWLFVQGESRGRSLQSWSAYYSELPILSLRHENQLTIE